MTILGIDPGPKQSAFCFWDGTAIEGFGIQPNFNFDSERSIRRLVSNDHADFDISVSICACEVLQCFAMPVGKEVFETAYLIGELRSEAHYASVEFLPVYRSEIKMYLCQSMRAKDANIAQALRDRFGEKGTKRAPGFFYGFKADMWSAFAIAVYAWDKAQK